MAIGCDSSIGRGPTFDEMKRPRECYQHSGAMTGNMCVRYNHASSDSIPPWCHGGSSTDDKIPSASVTR